MSSVSHAHSGPMLVPVTTPKKSALWAGRIISALPILMMAFSGVMKLTHAPQMVATWVNRFGWPEPMMTPIGLIELGCAILFAIPRTAVLGAILVATFFGAAFVTHLRIGDTGSGIIPIVLGILAWLGLYLRDWRLHDLVPLRRLPRETPSA